MTNEQIAAKSGAELTNGSGAPSTAERHAALTARYWQVTELVVIGIFAAVAKVSGILIILIGGGMNPITIIASNVISAALLLVLMHKTQKPGTLLIFLLVSAIIDILVLGGNPIRIPASLVAGGVAEGLIYMLGGYRRMAALIIGVAFYDLLSRVITIGFAWLMGREEPWIIIMVTIMVSITYLGTLIGLWLGRRFIGELRHAGIVRH
ncbi:MptD family putative ECF transporter S component [Halorhodospira halochloris]|uniref:MptD family putative ECF transporter S component n=1 Tax=Halorhodospira halochloris TaxID=1052 RepID=UPI001EE7CA70|nr:MptD family putative ECF transporter S component [Halorhodospira halochloris]MCG5529887.1 MptD family putative ECF transporter S component [Halorhodospira halochloris]MCG5549415.1 MptD family putative ECF transporter S component [Halorhodospira halochloris]